jgi:hypothetical protein
MVFITVFLQLDAVSGVEAILAVIARRKKSAVVIPFIAPIDSGTDCLACSCAEVHWIAPGA